MIIFLLVIGLFSGASAYGEASYGPIKEYIDSQAFYNASTYINSSSTSPCIRKHITDAISENRTRAFSYARMSRFRSTGVSSLLISSEVASIAAALIFDQRAKIYRKNGLPLLCLDLVDMALVPAQQKSLEEKRSSNVKYDRKHVRHVSIQLKKAYTDGGFDGLHYVSSEFVQTYESHPKYYCMTRHLLESIRRSAGLAPYYVSRAIEMVLVDPSNILKDYIFSQINILGLSYTIDSQAYSLSNMGLNIVCDDVPYIPDVSSIDIDLINSSGL